MPTVSDEAYMALGPSAVAESVLTALVLFCRHLMGLSSRVPLPFQEGETPKPTALKGKA